MKLQDNITQSVAEAVKKVKDLDVAEGKMKELHGYIGDGLSAEDIIKKMKLKKTPEMVKFIKGLMKEANAPQAKDATEDGYSKAALAFIKLHGLEVMKHPTQEEVEESSDVDGRTKAFKEKLKKLEYSKNNEEEEDEEEVKEGMLSKNDKTAGYAGRAQFDLKKHVMPLVKKNKALKDIYFDGPDLVGDTKKGKQVTIAKGVLTDKKMTVADLEKAIMSFKESIDKVKEGNEFTKAAAKAKLAGEDEFEFDGKTYPTEISQDAAEKILGKKESVEDLYELIGTLLSENVKCEECPYEEGCDPECELGAVTEAAKPEDFVKGGDTKITKREIDKMLSKIFINNKLAKAVEANPAYKAGEKDAGKKKNPYKKDTADFHLYILGTQSAQAS